jgi:tRNA dimethylallyltransferase
MNKPTLPPLALIAGPTASGKSALAMALADRVPSVIINADSMQVYADLRVVTARPSSEDESKVPHRLYGHIDGATACSAADWSAQAKAAIAEANAGGKLPILVGGTGLYVRTLLDGIAPIPDIDPAIRAEVRALPVRAAHAALAIEDPVAAQRLAPADTTRVARALEVVRSTGKPLAHWHAERSGGIGAQVALAPLILLPPRDWLTARTDQRFEAMFEGGQDEVAALVARNLPAALPVMRAIGVPEIAAFQSGTLAKTDAMTAGRLATRQYLKRQSTWFTRQTPAHWPCSEKTDLSANRAIMLQHLRLTA